MPATGEFQPEWTWDNSNMLDMYHQITERAVSECWYRIDPHKTYMSMMDATAAINRIRRAEPIIHHIP